MKQILFYFSFLVLTPVISCRTASLAGDDGKIEVVFLQVNDVYEIAPLSAGREGGIARIATVKKELLKNNPNTYMVMAGDFLSPSVYHSLRYQGILVRGKQMVESLNAAGLDLATFGNHEFDITGEQLNERINESAFRWISGNTFHNRNSQIRPFEQNGKPLPANYIMKVTDADGTLARIGVISVTLPFNRADYVSYTDPLATAKKIYSEIRDSVDAVIALTHQAVGDDRMLAKAIPELQVIMGGHEHDNQFLKEGNVFITKAHANAKSAYVLRLKIDKKKKKNSLTPELIYLNESVSPDPATEQVVKKWTSIAENNFSSLGFDANRVILEKGTGDLLDGRETEVRRNTTGLTRLIVKGIEFSAPSAEVAIMNGGSIRVDDVLEPPLTEYDMLRTLPFGGSIREVDLKGSLLKKILEQGRKNRGTGGFLQVSEGVTEANGQWTIKGQPLDNNRTYRVAFSEFLLTGKEANLEYLTTDNPEIIKIHDTPASKDDPRRDIRLAVIRYLEKVNAQK